MALDTGISPLGLDIVRSVHYRAAVECATDGCGGRADVAREVDEDGLQVEAQFEVDAVRHFLGLGWALADGQWHCPRHGQALERRRHRQRTAPTAEGA